MKPFYIFLCAMICSSLSGMESELEPEPIQTNGQYAWWLFGREEEEKVVAPVCVQPVLANTRVENNQLPKLAPVPASVVVALFPPLADVVFAIEAENNARHVICRVRNPNYQQALREKAK